MKIPKRGEKGFTLVELLIVLAILAVLAAVVIPNITGMMGRGAAQAFDTDEETIQMAAATFYFDVHDNGGGAGHFYPTVDGAAGTGSDPVETNVGSDLDAAGYKVIYMGLLVNTPGGASTGWLLDGAPADGEKGPYLNELPKSCSTDNSDGGEGTYTWAIGANGTIFGFHKVPGDTSDEYIVGFGDTYP